LIDYLGILNRHFGVFSRVEYHAGEVIFTQGDPGDCLYVIQRGHVMLRKRLPNGSIQTLATLGVGEMFGEMAIIDGRPRMASAQAVEGCELVRIPKATFEEHLWNASPFLRAIVYVLINHLRSYDTATLPGKPLETTQPPPPPHPP
jgi:CRP/FNR family transcriptional regulator, cyclic AMP receptor protein